MAPQDVPSTMRAAVYQKPRTISVERRPVPTPGPGEALIEVSHCGICGTDLHLVLEGMGRPNSIGGHEYSGRIAALGVGLEGWSVGDAVVGGPRATCGACPYCLAGRPSLCTGRGGFGGERDPRFHGAFAEYVLVRDSQLVRVPEGVSLRAAALTEPLAVALHAIARSGIQPGGRALVTGAGPLGLLIVAALRTRGIEEVAVSEPSRLRRERAGAVGATQLIEPDALDAPRMPFDLVDAPFDAVLECSGNPAAMEAGLAQLCRAGALVLVGTGMRRPRFDHNRILLNELIVTGAYNYDANGFRDALELLSRDAIPLDRLIEPRDVPLEGLLRALETLERQERGGKVLVAPVPSAQTRSEFPASD